jgi:hypothetical protein
VNRKERQAAKSAKKTESSKSEFLIPWRTWRLGGSIVFLRLLPSAPINEIRLR